jgi:hypothetical protein
VKNNKMTLADLPQIFNYWDFEDLEKLTKEELDSLHLTLTHKLEIVNDYHDHLVLARYHPEELEQRKAWRRARGEIVEPDPLA